MPRRRDEADESIGAFMTRRFGREADRPTSPSRCWPAFTPATSIGCRIQRVVSAASSTPSGVMAACFARFDARPDVPAQTPMAHSSRLPGGLSEMIRALVARSRPRDVRLEAPVRCVAFDTPPEPFFVETATVTCHAHAVVLRDAGVRDGRTATRRIDAELARLCDEFPTRRPDIVALAFRRDVAHPLNGSGFVVPRVEKTGILAGSWLSSKWPHRAPADRVLMRTFVGGARDPRALDQSDAELVERSMAALVRCSASAASPLFTRVYRWERANAQHEVGHLERSPRSTRRSADIRAFFSPAAAYRGVGIPDCVADGRATAKQVTGYGRRA